MEQKKRFATDLARRVLVRYLRQQNPDGSLSDGQLVDSFLHTCSEISQAAKTVSRSRRYDEVVDGALVMCKNLPQPSSIQCHYISEPTQPSHPKSAQAEPDDDIGRLAQQFLASIGRG